MALGAGDLDTALHEARAAVEEEPSSREARLLLALVLRERGAREEAGALLDGVQLSPAELEALLTSTRRALEYADPDTAHALCGLQRKVDTVMPAALRDALRPPVSSLELRQAV